MTITGSRCTANVSDDDSLRPCTRLATISCTRGSERKPRPRCDDHARWEVLLSERYGYAIVLVRHTDKSAMTPGQQPLF